MLLYKYFFYVTYRLIRRVELDLPSAKHGDRAFETVCIITLIQMFNLITIFDTANKKVFLGLSTAIIFVMNCIIFLSRNRFENIISQFNTTHPSNLIKTVVAGYLIISFAALVIVHMIWR
jgi:uncharacterized membrane protein (GlpM family)